MRKYILKYCEAELNLKNTFLNGQCFNWQECAPDIFSGVLFNRYFEMKRIDPESLENVEERLNDYFYRSISLKDMYQGWINQEQRFKALALKLPGTRILKQDPWECTISFICSSNNNISRITALLRSLKERFGRKIIQKVIDQKEYAFHEFPGLQQLLKATPEDLKGMGFGYRAEFIVDSVRMISENGGEKWIRDLVNGEYDEVKEKLMTLKGIGRKVADCICLFSLGCHDSVPIDTHMFQIAKKLGYVKQSEVKKSLSESLYRKIAQSYRDVYGEYAGWAQQIIFTGDLASYKSVMEPKQMIEESLSTTLSKAPVKIHKKR